MGMIQRRRSYVYLDGGFNQRLKIDTSVNEREIKRFLHIMKKK